MERNYKRQELENKTNPQLKDVLKSFNLPVSGTKNVLITRILDHQKPKLSLTNEPTYFDVLPIDIKNIVEKYRIENDSNIKILKEFLKLIKGNALSDRKTQQTILNNWFKDNDLNIEFEQSYESKSGWNFKIKKITIITDEILIDFIALILSNKWNLYPVSINYILDNLNSNIRVLEIYKSTTEIEAKHRFDIVYIKPIKSIIVK